MSKTIADLKRTIYTGLTIEQIKREERYFSKEQLKYVGEWYEVAVPEQMAGKRYVSHVNTVGFRISKPGAVSSGLMCDWPKKGGLEFEGDTFTITEFSKKAGPYQRRTYKIIKYR